MTAKTIKLIVSLFLFIFFSCCNKKNNQCRQDVEKKNNTEYQKQQIIFKNIINKEGEIIQTDTCNFTVIFNNPTLLKYHNIKFKRNAYKDYQFKITLKNILEKPLYIKTTNYYGYLQFNWELKKEDREYILQMTSETRDYVLDEFRLKKIGGSYSIYKVSNIIPLYNSQFSKQICILPIVSLQKDTIYDCTIDNFTNCILVK